MWKISPQKCPVFKGFQPWIMRGEYDYIPCIVFIKYCQHSRVQVLSGEPSKTAPRLFLFSLKIRLGAIATSRRQKAQRTSTSEEGAPAKSHDFVGRGGITEQASFGTLCPEVSKRSLCRRVPKSAGFGEAPQQAFLRPPWGAKMASVATLALLAKPCELPAFYFVHRPELIHRI
ncbi:MAG: hypothetical protein DBX63_07500 [Clostridia bacterium]|nr:MAG: hypothetical protein DBX63_07500 [Clostridia bacterium]